MRTTPDQYVKEINVVPQKIEFCNVQERFSLRDFAEDTKFVGHFNTCC